MTNQPFSGIRAFVTISYVNILKLPMVMLPFMIIGLIQVRHFTFDKDAMK